MAKVCMDCLESYGEQVHSFKLEKDEIGTYMVCPKRGCSGTVVDIDDIFAPIIVLLNEKGYYTKECCSGHMEEFITESYITFETDMDLLPNIPQGYKLRILKAESGEENVIMFKRITGRNTIEIFQEILNNALQTYAWALGLPEIELEFDDIFNLFHDIKESSTEEDPESEAIDTSRFKDIIKNGTIEFKDFKSPIKRHRTDSEVKKDIVKKNKKVKKEIIKKEDKPKE